MKQKPSIVVLDGYTLNPGDLSWKGVEALGECAIYDRTPPEQVASRADGAEIVLTNKVVLGREIIETLTDLKYIGVLATGYNVVDLDAANDRHIPVTNVPEYGTASVAQMVFALLLELTQRAASHSQAVHSGRWSKSIDFCFWDYPLIELAGKTMGIVGYGRIGRAVARIARAFDMQVLVFDTKEVSSTDTGINAAGLDELFRNSDIVTLHCPLTPESGGMVNAERLSLMKQSAYLINTGRGPLVNERDLARALADGIIAGAGIDVMPVEPPPADSPLFDAPNCIITPHIAWATRAARRRLMGTVVDNISAFLSGTPIHVVNQP